MTEKMTDERRERKKRQKREWYQKNKDKVKEYNREYQKLTVDGKTKTK